MATIQGPLQVSEVTLPPGSPANRLPEELPADHKFLQRRSDGTMTLDEAFGLSSSSRQDGAGYLLSAARSLGLDRENYRRLGSRLDNNALTVTEPDVMEGFDAANANRTRAAGIRKSLAAARRFDSYEPLLDTMTPQERRNVLRATLEVAARTGQMPVIAVDPQQPGQVDLAFREANVEPGSEPGTLQVSDRLHLWQYNARTDEAVRLNGGPENIHTISEGHAYNSNGQSIQQDQTERLAEAFGSRSGQRALNNLYDGTFRALDDPAEMRRLLLPVVENIENAYGLQPVDFQVNPDPVSSGSMAAYEPDTNRMIINHQGIAGAVRNYMAENGLDPADPDHREQVREYAFRELVDSTAHELTHADQARRIRALENGGVWRVGDVNRVDDYRINTDYYNASGETLALIGRDQGHYRYQPLEDDAWAVGQQAGRMALDAVSWRPRTQSV